MVSKLGAGIIVAGIVLLVAVSLTFFVGVPIIIKNKVTEETQLVNGSETYKKWEDVPIPILLKFHFFNITDPLAIEEGRNLTLQEIGPYVYEEDRYKKIHSENEDEDSITYEEFTVYRYRQDLSDGRSEEDTFNLINFPYVTVSTVLTKKVPLLSAGLIALLQGAKQTFVLQNVKVREIIFDGIELPQIYNTLLGLSGETPPEFEGGRFAFYRGRNDSSDGIYKINRGIKSYKEFGNIISFDGMKEVPWWTNTSLPIYEQQYCNKINGSDGSVFPPFFEKDRIMRIFVLDICRSIYLTYDQEMDFHGIKGWRFTIPPFMFAHPDINPDNKCFCTDPGAGLSNYCAGGLIRIYECKSGAPLITSQPHFLDGDAQLFNYLNGLSPNRSLHETRIEVEPRSGELLRATKRIQINIELQPLPRTSAFNKIPAPGIAVPLFWAEEAAELDQENIDDLKDKLIKPLSLLNTLQWVAIGVTCGIVVIGMVVAFIRR